MTLHQLMQGFGIKRLNSELLMGQLLIQLDDTVYVVFLQVLSAITSEDSLLVSRAGQFAWRKLACHYVHIKGRHIALSPSKEHILNSRISPVHITKLGASRRTGPFHCVSQSSGVREE